MRILHAQMTLQPRRKCGVQRMLGDVETEDRQKIEPWSVWNAGVSGLPQPRAAQLCEVNVAPSLRVAPFLRS